MIILQAKIYQQILLYCLSTDYHSNIDCYTPAAHRADRERDQRRITPRIFLRIQI